MGGEEFCSSCLHKTDCLPEKELNYEQKNVSAQQHQTCPYPWFSRSNENPFRSGRDQEEKGKRPNAIGCLKQLGCLTLPKNHRLRTTGEFQRVYRSGQRLRGKGFALIFLDNAFAYTRLGISVHRKAGNAVRRNRIKRLLREVFRLHRDLFPARSDVVLTIRPGFAIDGLEEMLTGIRQAIGTCGGNRDARA